MHATLSIISLLQKNNNSWGRLATTFEKRRNLLHSTQDYYKPKNPGILFGRNLVVVFLRWLSPVYGGLLGAFF
jgi:hypothetical protein